MKDRLTSLMIDPVRVARFLWGAALLTIPVTSFRWFPLLGEGTVVRPLALYPLALLIPLLLLLARRGRIRLYVPATFVPLVVFVLFALASAALGRLIDPIPLRGQEYAGRALRAIVTLMIGIVFFVCAVWMNRDEHDLRFSVKWILAGLCVDLAWSGLQAVTFYTGLLEKEMVTHWQLAFSTRELIRTNRISGLAYEPAWLAGQLATIFIPILFAAVLTNFRLTRFKWLEPVLLGFALLLLLATYSRGGLLITMAAASLTFLLLGRDMMRSIWTWFRAGLRGRTLDALLRVGVILAILGSLTGTFLFLSQKNFFRRLWEIDAASLSEYMIDINAGARSAYSTAALAAFHEHPWSGVGLGASGFTMYGNLPDWTLTTVPEIAKQLSPENRLYPNPKNLHVRLLAETGLIGFILFLAFQLHVLGDILAFLLRTESWARFAALTGLFAWLAITFYNFTQDSLTTPNIWLLPGILVGLSTTSLNRKTT